jgi:hypothetical protein
MDPVCRKVEGWSHIMRCEGTKNWRDELLDKKFTSVGLEIRIREFLIRPKTCCKKTGFYLKKI